LLYCVVTLYKKIPPNLLEAWQRLKVLRLEHNGLGGEGICSLSKPIALFHGLTILQLGANRIGQHNTAGAAALSRALAQGPAPSLRVLGLGENNLGPEGLQVLAPALRALRSLQHLDLNANRLAAKGATTLAEAMGSCSSLTTLALNFNFLGEDGIKSMAPVLGAQLSLTNLDISFNDIGPAGVEALVEGLANERHQGFVRLDLAKNTLGAKGANLLFPLLRRSASTLSYVCLKFNGLGQQHAAMVKCQVPRAQVQVLEEMY
jgi:Ran GTPase-activating protein (RanGAP) involved in mRNA processing and transport